MVGQTATDGVQVACVNPAALVGGSASLDSFFPYLSGVAKSKTSIVLPAPDAGTSWFEFPGEYQASCQHADGATWLQVTKAVGPADHRPGVTEVLGAAWGYHEDDTNLALGDLVADVAAAEATWRARPHDERRQAAAGQPLQACGERLHDFRALLMLMKWVANRFTPEGRSGRIRQLLPDGPTSRKLVKQERGSLRPDSATPVLAHHKKFGDVMWFSGKDQGKAGQCVLYLEQERLAV